MKLIYLILILFLGFSYSLYAQDCSIGGQLPEGKTLEVSNYDKKDKFTGKIVRSVLEEKVENGRYTWVVKQKTYNKKEGSSA